MTWLDLVAVVLLVLVSVLEARRGAVPAAAELAAGLIGLGFAKTLATTMVGTFETEATAFLVLFALAVGLAALAGGLTDTYTKWDIGPYDKVVASIIGMITGLALANGAFHAALLAEGGLKATAEASLLYGQVYQLDLLHAIGDMLRNLGGGQTFVDKVREQHK
jgi:uncharacterized membrane protein required for colicin V production